MICPHVTPVVGLTVVLIVITLAEAVLCRAVRRRASYQLSLLLSLSLQEQPTTPWPIVPSLQYGAASDTVSQTRGRTDCT